MYVNLIVDSASKQPDKLFTYFADDRYELFIGDRVVVPFGRNDKATPALVYSILENKPDFSCKEILYVLDKKYSFSKSQLYLIYLLRLYYASTYWASYRLILPSQQDLLIIKKYRINEDELFQLNLGDVLNEKEIKKLLSKKDLDYLLKNKKIIQINNYELKVSKSKIEKIKVQFNNLEAALSKINKNATKQERILKYVHSCGEVEYRKLISACSCNRVDVMNLVKKNLLSLSSMDKPINLSRYSASNKKSKSFFKLSEEQEKVFDVFKKHKKENKSEPFKALINGVTGSGKTRIYLEIVKEILKEGKQALFLLPEIALTPQLISSVSLELSDDVAVIHTHVSDKDKASYYENIKSGRIKLVVGARSALFAPFKDLGIIVIDESHERTYKSDQNPRYDATTLSMELSKLISCDIILGSATTSLEHFYISKKENYYHLYLSKRVGKSSLPEIYLIDMNESERLDKKGERKSQISKILYNKLSETFKKGEQAMILHNRKGYSSYRECMSCSHIEKCINCDVSMYVLSKSGDLLCRYCDYKIRGYNACSKCFEKLVDKDLALKSVQEEMEDIFPDKKFVSLDSDSTRKSEEYLSILNDFSLGKIDAILGTQVIAKGFDFENVTLAAVINADRILNSPDYSAAERAFALMYQLAGRAGRRKKKGRVYIQCRDVNHRALRYLLKNDYIGFLKEENELRKLANFPPYSNLIAVKISSEFDNLAKEQSLRIQSLLYDFSKKNKLKLIVYGVREQFYLRLKNKYNYYILIKNISEEYTKIVNLLYNVVVIDKYKIINKSVLVNLDFNPYVL